MGQNRIKNPDFTYSSDKEKIFDSYCNTMFKRLKSMFVYRGLPETIPSQWLEEYLMKNGSCAIIEEGGELYAVLGSAGGELDIYYQPTLYVEANPALSKKYPGRKTEHTIGVDCVYARNDYNASGLIPLISRYCGLMTENYITTRIADINMRMTQIMSAPDDSTAESARRYLADIEQGKLGVISETAFFDGLKVQSESTSGSDRLIQFIELQQYTKGSLYNEIGLDANWNMKREALSADEVALNDDALMPLIDDMLKERRAFCAKIEDLFGVHIEVDYGSSWHANSVEKQASLQTTLSTTEEMASNTSDEMSLDNDETRNQAGDNAVREAVDDETASQLAEDNDVSNGDSSDEEQDGGEVSEEEISEESSDDSSEGVSEDDTSESDNEEVSQLKENENEETSEKSDEDGDKEEETPEEDKVSEEDGDSGEKTSEETSEDVKEEEKEDEEDEEEDKKC